MGLLLSLFGLGIGIMVADLQLVGEALGIPEVVINP